MKIYLKNKENQSTSVKAIQGSREPATEKIYSNLLETQLFSHASVYFRTLADNLSILFSLAGS